MSRYNTTDITVTEVRDLGHISYKSQLIHLNANIIKHKLMPKMQLTFKMATSSTA